MFENDDMILPEGFDPALGDQNFNEDGELSFVEKPAPAEEPTIAQPVDAQPAVETTTQSTETQDPTTSQEEVPQPVVPQTVKVKYNHEERELSLDEAALYAQKGMNYDRMEQRSKEQETKLSRFEELAKMFGYDNAEMMMQQAEQNYVDVKVKDLVDQGNTEAVARFLVTQELAKAKATLAEKPKEPEAQAGLTADKKAELNEFATAYPGVTKIPDEVFKMNSEGVRLKTAYQIYEKQQALEAAAAKAKAAEDELAILRQNQASAAKGPVTGTMGTPAGATKQEADDPFMIGFDDSDY